MGNLALVKPYFHGFYLGKPDWMGVSGAFRYHRANTIKAFSKLVSSRLAIKVKILAMLEDLVKAMPLGINNLRVEGFQQLFS